MDRFFAEFRAEADGTTLRGTAAVFGPMAKLPGHYERLAPGAFDAALKRDDVDVVALFNHDVNQPLGRQSAGNLRLSADARGLHFEVDLPDTTAGRDVREMVRTGLVRGASFGFIPGEDSWDKVDGHQVRTHTSVARLLDVSPVVWPAYTETQVALRHLDFGMPNLCMPLRQQLIVARQRAREALGGR